MDRSLPQPRIRKNRLAWAYGVFKAQGPFGVLRCIGRAFVDAGFDIRYGTDTARWVEMHTLSVQGEHRKDALPYIPTQISPLRTVLRKLDLPKDGTFIDLGSGKGRVLLIAAQCGFQRIVGVEFSRELCEIARENVKIFLRQTQITAQIEIIESDVATWPVHREDNVFFMFHPFKRTVLVRFLDNLRNSLTEFPRKVWLVYHNPTEEHAEVIANFKLFRVSQEFEPSGASYAFRVYHN